MMSPLEQVLSRTFIDQNFRREVVAHPEKIAREYDLAAGDLAALRLLSSETWSEDVVLEDETWPDDGGVIRRVA
jgi:hypothetical protein